MRHHFGESSECAVNRVSEIPASPFEDAHHQSSTLSISTSSTDKRAHGQNAIRSLDHRGFMESSVLPEILISPETSHGQPHKQIFVNCAIRTAKADVPLSCVAHAMAVGAPITCAIGHIIPVTPCTTNQSVHPLLNPGRLRDSW